MTVSNDKVVVTGVGPVTAIAIGREALWSALMEGRTNVQPRTVTIDLERQIELPMAAMAPGTNIPELDTHNAFLATQDLEGYRDLAYALLSVELALADAGIEYDRDDNRIGAIQAFEAPGVERTVAWLCGLKHIRETIPFARMMGKVYP